MVARVNTVAFQGIDVLPVDVQVQISGGVPAFSVVGLPDKAVAESRERGRGALHALGLSLPPKRLTVNLAPADVTKEGSHYDLPIALGLLAAMEVLPREEIRDYVVLGELALDGGIRPVTGVLPAAVHANAIGCRLICPAACGGEAAWAGGEAGLDGILAPRDLLAIINHVKGIQILPAPVPKLTPDEAAARPFGPDLADVRGQETAKRALEIAAAGGHNLLMVGPPGSGKSMMASCLPGILPPLSPREALEASMIHSLAGTLPEGGLLRRRPFRDPHHSASLPALVGGGARPKPGEISLAHHGVLFLDELPEFARATLESLRQPLETGQALVARASQHVTYPARFQLIAAMNPCRCGNLGDTSLECTRAPRCAAEYQDRLSGPFLDRIDLQVDVPPVRVSDLGTARTAEPSARVAARVAAAREIQVQRYRALDPSGAVSVNARAGGEILDRAAPVDDPARELLNRAAESMKLSARSYHRVLRVARTIADLAGGTEVLGRIHVAEALVYRRTGTLDRTDRAA